MKIGDRIDAFVEISLKKKIGDEVYITIDVKPGFKDEGISIIFKEGVYNTGSSFINSVYYGYAGNGYLTKPGYFINQAWKYEGTYEKPGLSEWKMTPASEKFILTEEMVDLLISDPEMGINILLAKHKLK